MSKPISKNSNDSKNSNKIKDENSSDVNCLNPYLQLGSYIWGLVGTAIANQVNHKFKDDQKAEI